VTEKPRAPSIRALNKQLQPALYLLMIGMIGFLVAGASYPPLDLNALMLLGLGLFFLPLLAHIVVHVRKRLAANVGRLRRIYLWAGALLIGMGVALGFNGLADRTPPRLVRTSITRKHTTRGRSSVGHILTLASWRPGRAAEEINVSSAEYRGFQVGDQVVVEVHAGWFRVPWWGRVCRDDHRYGGGCE
jgi:hypothetical protein